MIRLSDSEAALVMEILNANGGVAAAQLSLRIAERLEFKTDELGMLERIVAYLKIQPSGQVFSEKVVQKLRNILLTPREMQEWMAQEEKPMVCASCHGEIADMSVGIPSKGKLYCVNCMTPEKVYCPNHDGAVEITGNAFRRILMKTIKECPVCADRNRTTAPPVAEEEEAIRATQQHWIDVEQPLDPMIYIPTAYRNVLAQPRTITRRRTNRIEWVQVGEAAPTITQPVDPTQGGTTNEDR